MQNIREAITNLLMNGVDRAYDTDLAAALLVKDEMRKRGFRFSLMQWDPNDADVTWAQFERFSDHPNGAAFGEAEGVDIPLVICEAALDALEAEREHKAAADDARAMSGEYVMPPQVAALLRSGGGGATVPKAPERNWDALIEAARRKPRTDDDVLREKFGGGGDKASLTNAPVQTGQMRHAAAPAPSSDLDLYEPVGTVPIVGDRVVCLINPCDSYPWVSRIHEEGARFASDDGVFEVRDCEFRRYDDRAWRILKRKAQTPQVPQADAPSSDNSVPRHDHERLQVRARKNRYNDKIVYLNCNGRGFSYCSAMGGWHRDSVCDNMVFEDDGFEFAAQEALELWRSCATAVNLDFETGYPPVRTQPPAAPSQPFYYTPNGIVALGSNTARFAEYTLTYYDTGGPGSIVLGGGAAS